MALPTVSPALPASPQVIGNAFIHQYYKILHESPGSLHKFYQDSSILNRPNSEGAMSSVTTIQAINDLISSLDFSVCYTEIETVDSQISYKDGVLIIVTGSFTGTDNIRRKFTQTFFLAPQEHGGFFVRNDVFRFLNETQTREMHHLIVNDSNDDAPIAHLTPEIEPTLMEHRVDEDHLSEVEVENNNESLDPSKKINVAAEAVVDPPIHVVQKEVQALSEVTAYVAQDDAPKKSYASILKVMKGSLSQSPINVATSKVKATPVSTEKPATVSTVSISAAVSAKPVGASASTKPVDASASTKHVDASASTKHVDASASTKPASAPENLVPTSNNAAENYSHEEESHSIYIKNLPMNATPEQVEEEFKNFGSIKPGGVQVRSHKMENFCFGFVEFDLAKSMLAAIEASPVMIGGRQAFVEEKRTTTRVVNGVVTTSGNGNGGRGRFQQGRGGFRNDTFRGRGNFGGNPGFRRNEFRNQLEFSGRRGPVPRGGDGYQHRIFQNGNGRIGRPNEPKPTAVAA